MDWRKVNWSSLWVTWKYRHFTLGNQSIFSKISAKPKTSQLLTRHNYHEAYAYLKPEYLQPTQGNVIYGSPSGTGSSFSSMTAVHKAISESLERWAYSEARLTSQFGFKVDPTTNGMATHPHPNTARRIAKNEAIERWALSAWWEGRLQSNEISPNQTSPFLNQTSGIEVIVPDCESKLCILWSHDPQLNLYSYGFAAHKTLASAIQKAAWELIRNAELLAAKIDLENLPTDAQEKRLLYFSTQKGFAQFYEKMQSSPEKSQQRLPTPVFDSAIPGPWSEFTTVWRCAFEPVSSDFYNKGITDYFWF